MTLTDMATEVAKSALGAHNTAATVTLAQTAIKASISDWNAAKNWNFLLRDTAASFTVANLATHSNTTVDLGTGGVTGSMDGINRNVTVSGSGIPDGTTVASYTRGTDGTITALTLSAAATTSVNPITLTFTGNIPLIASVQEYNLPTDFASPYAARTTTNPRLLHYIEYREWNLKIVDQSTTGLVEAYTIYNPVSPQTQNYGTYRLRVFRTPANSDTLHVQYFRDMNPDATTVDIPDAYIYMLIDYAIWRLVRLKDTEDTRLPHLYEVAQKALQTAMIDDEEKSEVEQVRIMSQFETWTGEKLLWANGEFWP